MSGSILGQVLVTFLIGWQAVPLSPVDDALPQGAVARLGSTRFRLGGAVDSLSISTDGTKLACIDRNGRLSVLDAKTGIRLRSIDHVNAAVIAPDGQHIVSITITTVHIRDIGSGKILRQFKAHDHWISSLALSRDGHILATIAPDEKIVKLWNCETGQERRTIRLKDAYSASISPDGKTLATGGWTSGAISLWETSTGRQMWETKAPADCVQSLAFSPNGEMLAIRSEKHITLLNADSGKAGVELAGTGIFCGNVVFAPTGNVLVAGAEDGTICVWDARNGALSQRLEGNGSNVDSLVFSTDGRLLYCGQDTGAIHVWSRKNGFVPHHLPSHARVSALLFTSAGQLITAGGNRIYLWDLGTERVVKRFDGQCDGITAIALRRDGRVVVSADGDGAVFVWDASTGKQLSQLTKLADPIYTVAFSPDSKTLAAGGFDSKIRLLNPATGDLIKTISGHDGAVVSLAYAPNGKVVASLGGDGGVFGKTEDRTCRLWDALTGRLLFRHKLEHLGRAIAFAQDGKSVAIACSDCTLRLIAVPDGKQFAKMLGHKAPVECICFSSDGRVIASGSQDGAVHIWDAKNRKQLAQFLGHLSRVNCIAFSADGRTVASGSDDGTTIIWGLQELNKEGRNGDIRK